VRGTIDGDVLVLQIVVLVWLLGWAARTMLRIARGDTRTILLVELIFILFFGGPLLLDLAYGAPEYSYQWGFIVSQYDRATNLIYLAYVAVAPLMLDFFGGRRTAGGMHEPITLELTQWPRALAWMVVLALPASLLVAPRPELFLRYASAIRDPTAQANVLYFLVITISATLAIIASVLILASRGTRAIERLIVTPLLMLALWTQGKRSSVALASLLLLYLLWMRGILRGPRFIAAALSVGLALAGFSYLYQTEIREVGADDRGLRSKQASTFYVNARIDYGRDAVMKQAVYAELNPDRLKILEYRGQTMVFYSLFFVPRRLWPGKPFPYPVYVTAAMLRAPPRDYRWGVTTSIFDESVANFGWLGLLVAPIVLGQVCAIGDRRRSPFVAMLTVTIGSLLVVLNLGAFIPITLLWIMLVWRTKPQPLPGREHPPSSTLPRALRDRITAR
jgi:hypothetical protein